MTRGKYSGRAANRLANIDNGLLREQLDKVASLEAELARVNLELTHCKTTISSQVIRGSARMSRERIAEIEHSCAERIAEIQAQRDENGHWAADRLWRHFATTGDKTIPQFIFVDIVPRLVPESDRNDFINGHLEEGGAPAATRRVRRHAAENIQRSIALDANDNKHDVVSKTAIAAALGDEKSIDFIRTLAGGSNNEAAS
jgi:hypothetical protein